MFKNDDRIQVVDFSQENVTEMSQELLWWKQKKQASREEKVWRSCMSTAGKAWDTLERPEHEGMALAGLTLTALFFN